MAAFIDCRYYYIHRFIYMENTAITITIIIIVTTTIKQRVQNKVFIQILKFITTSDYQLSYHFEF